MAGPSGLTPALQVPYPTPDDNVDVPRDIKAVADWLDANAGRERTVYSQIPVLDVGMVGQLRAGRQLTLADFTSLGLGPPNGLWNLSDLSDASGNGRALSNKGAVPFAPGINGLASTAAQFVGSTGQGLYIPDAGSPDPFRLRSGTVGAWIRTAKRSATNQYIVSKVGSSGGASVTNYGLYVSQGQASVGATFAVCDGASVVVAEGHADVADDRWHFIVGTYDGKSTRVYVDGVLDGLNGAFVSPLAQPAVPFNIGGFGADSSTVAGYPFYGRIDEAFLTYDVLTEEQIRMLYCAKLAHSMGATPHGARLNVYRRRRSGTWSASDFSTQPLRLHNFTGGSLADQGSQGVALVNAGVAPAPVAGADGAALNALLVGQSATMHVTATDAGLPSGLSPRSYGLWAKFPIMYVASVGVMGWGTYTTADARLVTTNNGTGTFIQMSSGADVVSGPMIATGEWHLLVVVEDNTAADGLKRKLYLDGRCVASSTVMNSITLQGAGRFRIGANPDGSAPCAINIDGAFVCGYAMGATEVQALWAKGVMSIGASPKNAGDHIEGYDGSAILATFDMLPSNSLLDLEVMA